MKMQVRSLAKLSGLRIQHCYELWCRSQTWLDLALLWLWCSGTVLQWQLQFDPWPDNFHMLQMWPEKAKQKNKATTTEKNYFKQEWLLQQGGSIRKILWCSQKEKWGPEMKLWQQAEEPGQMPELLLGWT